MKGDGLKIAITSDVHMTTVTEHPERKQTLEKLLHKIVQTEISHLIIAGDCFDAVFMNYSELEHLCTKREFQNIKIMLIPGNHDAKIKPKHFSAPNIRILAHPEIMQFDLMSIPILLVPFQFDVTFGDVLAEFKNQLDPFKWILIGHGDWSDGLKEINPSEPGVYMPITRTDVEMYKPLKAILGHVHKPLDSDPIYYCGSPCPLDITETGRRRFFILETETASINSIPIESEKLYFNEKIMVVPGGGEWERLETQIRQKIESWGIKESEKKYIQIRVQIYGFTSDKAKLAQIASQCLKAFRFYHDEEIDLRDVFVVNDSERAEIVNRTVQEIKSIHVDDGKYNPQTSAVLFKALKTIYEVE